MADQDQDEGRIPGMSQPAEEAFPHSTFYDNLLASTLNVPTNNPAEESEGYPTWSTYGASDPNISLGYNAWSSFGRQPDFGNSYADAYATSGHVPTTPQFNQSLEDYFSALGNPSQQSLHTESNEPQNSQDSYTSAYANTSLQGLNVNLDFMQSAADGRDLYADAFQQWGGATVASSIPSADSSTSSATASPPPFTGRAYDPFGTTDVFPNVESMKQTSMEAQEEMVSSRTPVDRIFSNFPSSSPPQQKSTKPSYSDVARNKLSGNAQNTCSVPNKREDSQMRNAAKSDTIPPSQSSSTATVPLKPKKFKSGRSAKKRSVPVESTIRPDSRYGLDSFDDPGMVSGVKDKHLPSRVNNSNESSRKGSFSSVGSGASGIEEIEKHTCDTAPVNVYDIQGPGPGVGMKYDSKTGEVIKGPSTSTAPPAASNSKPSSKVPNTEQANRGSTKRSGTTKNMPKSGSASTDKVFFDPKRIFTSEKEKQAPNNKNYIPNNQQNLRKDEEDLNNGKAKSNWKSGSTRYINNDLRDSSKKQTNTESRNSSNTTNMYSEKTKEGERSSSTKKKKVPTATLR